MNEELLQQPANTKDTAQLHECDEYNCRAERVNQMIREQDRIKREERKQRKLERQQQRFDELMLEEERNERANQGKEPDAVKLFCDDELIENLRSLLPRNRPGTAEARLWNAFNTDKSKNV